MTPALARSVRRPGGYTVIELLVTTIIGIIITGTIFMIYNSSRVQERSISRYVDVQRSLRGSMALVQRDLRAVKEVIELERESNGTLKSFLFRVPSGDNKSTTSITYTFDPRGTATAASAKAKAGIFKRNGRLLFEDCLVDFQLFPFVLEDGPREVKESTEYGRINLFKIKLTFLPGKTEVAAQGVERTFAFTIYPRIVNLRRKSVMSRFNLLTGRFAPQVRPSSPPSEEPE